MPSDSVGVLGSERPERTPYDIRMQAEYDPMNANKKEQFCYGACGGNVVVGLNMGNMPEKVKKVNLSDFGPRTANDINMLLQFDPYVEKFQRRRENYCGAPVNGDASKCGYAQTSDQPSNPARAKFLPLGI